MSDSSFPQLSSHPMNPFHLNYNLSYSNSHTHAHNHSHSHSHAHPNSSQQQFQIPQFIPASSVQSQQPVPPRFRSKSVCKLKCKFCQTPVCNRGMKAILLADAGVELFSTDTPPKCVQLVNDDYTTQKCRCRIRDVACLGCGNVVGYHVTQPCKTCLDACNNGHFWMFHMEQITYTERLDSSGTKVLLWASLPHADRDKEVEHVMLYEQMCR
ncbi:FAM72 protein-domain-containing protein [Paraphysoderma sedebokerense]|nr:FAM72 protein-domain-containing protein [Paraphysoderma sedebokerense]